MVLSINFRNKVLLIAILVSSSSLNCGFEMMHKISFTMMRSGYSVALHSSKRYCSSVEFKGEYVSADSNGNITIRQGKYPIYSEAQNLHLKSKKIISDLKIGKNDMPYHIIELDESERSTEMAGKAEKIINSSKPLFNIVDSTQIKDKPYSSIGQLEMCFPKQSR